MSSIAAVGFDLFNTLITVEPPAVHEAISRLTASLRQSGFPIDGESFAKEHRKAALQFLEESRRSGRETHNRFWISHALQELGCGVSPDDPRICRGVEAYFSAFLAHSHLVPGTLEMLRTLRGRYRLGLLSNFTHAPAAWQIIGELGLTPFFDVVVISGEEGYRKPHPKLFQRFMEGLGVEGKRLLFVGDDLYCDVQGAKQSGIHPVWTTVVMDQKIVHHRMAETPVNGKILPPGVPRISTWDDLITLLDHCGAQSP